jgi:hypothetical protein
MIEKLSVAPVRSADFEIVHSIVGSHRSTGASPVVAGDVSCDTVSFQSPLHGDKPHGGLGAASKFEPFCEPYAHQVN